MIFTNCQFNRISNHCREKSHRMSIKKKILESVNLGGKTHPNFQTEDNGASEGAE